MRECDKQDRQAGGCDVINLSGWRKDRSSGRRIAATLADTQAMTMNEKRALILKLIMSDDTSEADLDALVAATSALARPDA